MHRISSLEDTGIIKPVNAYSTPATNNSEEKIFTNKQGTTSKGT
jgi:hypothetical protein